MPVRSSPGRGSQVLEEFPHETRRARGSSTNLSMRDDGNLQLRLISPKNTPEDSAAGLPSKDEGPPSAGPPATGRKDSQQTAKPRPNPLPRKHEKLAPDRILDRNFTLSPDSGHLRPLDSMSSHSYDTSNPKTLIDPELVLGFPTKSSVPWQPATPSKELVTLPLTLGLPSPREGQNAESRPEWTEIQRLRTDVWSLRSQIHEMRASLREMQEVKSAADDMLFRRITYMTACGLSLADSSISPFSDQKSLRELMNDCQRARNEYGPLEDDCNRAEDRLYRKEFNLARLEDQFFTRSKETQNQLPKPQRPPPPDAEHSPPSSIASDDDDFELSEYHPWVNEYLSKLGDLDLIQESLHEFRGEKAALEAKKQFRHRMGMALEPDDQEWLDNAEAEYAEITGKLQSLEKELEILKQRCLSKKLIDEDGEPTSFQDREAAHFAEEEDLNPRDEISEYVKYPLLLPYPGVKQEDRERYEPKPDVASEYTTTTRINKWMLDKLQISALDVNLLASTFESLHGKPFQEWEFRVLGFWYHDGTFRNRASLMDVPPASQSSMSTKHPNQASNTSDLSQEHIGGSVHALLPSSDQPISENSDETERALGRGRALWRDFEFDIF